MKASTIFPRLRNSKTKLWAVAFWLLVWYAAARLIGQEILLASPVSVFLKLIELVKEAVFWQRCAFSLMRIFAGLLLGALIGAGLGALSSRFRVVEELLHPLISVIRSIPVASFIILALVWLNERSLSVFIVLLIVLPVFYLNTLSGIRAADSSLLEMAKVFRLSHVKRIKAIYLPALVPYLLTAADVAVGLAWKSGIAAEVIAVPRGSIGEKLYYAKVYLMTSELLAWTVVIVLISALCSLALKLILKSRDKKHE